MGLLDWFRNDNLNEEIVTVQAGTKKENTQTVDDDILSTLKDATLQDLRDLINKLKEISKDKRNLYEVYDKMALDSLVSGAMKILSDDIVKKDFIRKKRFWAEPVVDGSEDGKEIVDAVNDFLEDFDMDSKAWGYAWRLLKFGEVYLKTYNSEFSKGDIEKEFEDRNGTIFEIVPNPADVLALEKYGTLVGFGIQKRDDKGEVVDGYDIVNTSEYIHIVQDQKMLRQKVTLKYKDPETNEEKIDTFQSVVGTSYLEDARHAWSIMDLIETLLLYARYNQSDYFKIAQVEVGNASRGEATRILRDTKRTLNNQDAMNMKEETYAGYKKPVPHGGIVYSAVRNGKGSINIIPVGADFDIKSIVDLDYWRDKEVAALAVPKAYLGLDDDNLTGLNNQSLTRQDIRYCRTVEAEKDPLIKGIKDICDYYLIQRGKGESLDDYKIVGAEIMSAETTDRMEDIEARIELANTLKDFMSQVKTIDMDKAVKIIVQKILNLQSVDPAFDDIWNGDVMTQDPDEAEDVEMEPRDKEESNISEPVSSGESDVEDQEAGYDTEEPNPIGPGAPV